MVGTEHSLADLEARALSGGAFTRADVERVLGTSDVVSVGLVGEAARRNRSGDRVMYGRVVVVTERRDVEVGHAGEVRVTGVPGGLDEALAWVRHAVALGAGVPVAAFSLADLMDLAGGDLDGLTHLASSLREAGAEAVADVPLDRLGASADAIAIVRAVNKGGLQTRRLTVDRASLDERVALAERAVALQQATGGIRAFAPLPRLDSATVPSTGYDDVKTIAMARLLCADIPFIQVDWPLYGPKLAQVAIAFGANDIDGIASVDALDQGPRRTASEDIARQIRAASAQPAERDARYELRP